MRTEKQKKTKERMRRAAKTALSLAVIMLLTIGFWTQPACAQEAPSGKPASLTVHFVYADKETEIPIEGAEFEIYQVGVFDETVRYVKAERFADVKVADFEELKTAAQLQEAAKRFAEAAKKQQADGVKQTDAKGESRRTQRARRYLPGLTRRATGSIWSYRARETGKRMNLRWWNRS